MKIQIKNRWDFRVIFECEADSMKLAVELAVKSKADLSSADLSSADLRSADLSSADLRSANLSSADLRSADLRSANLSSANLSLANLILADLSLANLSSANLSSADLRSADLSKEMKIILFKAERTKNLKAVEIKPNGDVVLSGRNGQGKSNILNVIMSVLTGKKLEDPIKHGEENAECLIDVGDFKVMKKWTAKGEYIKVIMANGDVKAKPMEFLGGIIGDISFDPLEFSRMKPKEQQDILKKIAGLEFSDIDAEYQKAYEARTEVNVKIKGIIAQLQAIQAPHPQTPDEEISYKEKLVELQQLRDKRKEFLKVIEANQFYAQDIDICEQDISKMEQQILDIQYNIKMKKEHIRKRQESIDNAIVPPEVTENEIIAGEASLQDIEKMNVEIRMAIRYRKLVKESNSVKEEADGFTQKLNRLEQDKATRIANAPMPINGLSLGNESVMYNGEIFSNLSEGQKTKVSTAISMALNPLLKIIFIRRWADLDSEGKKELTELAHQKGYDIWAEVVEESGELGYFIEAGEVKAIDGKPVEVSNVEEQPAGNDS